MSGKVTLVGAGPGDPGLLTLKGLAALSQAEVVVYDRLVSPAILAMIPPEARTIDVGKEATHHKVPQQQINRILLEEALAGRNVVRLKGGDPFVFGRGGEELEMLAAHGVPFEEVPGVTSAVAAPAYAGIPVTHRDHGSSVHIITGYQRLGKPLSIDFEALVRSGGTLVFLMGVAALSALAEGLLQAGMVPDTPAAAVENGTTSAQRRCDATLATLPERAAAMGIRSPAVIVVGEVCALAPRLCWFDRLPLRGQRILVTRPRERAGALSEELRSLGEAGEQQILDTQAAFFAKTATDCGSLGPTTREDHVVDENGNIIYGCPMAPMEDGDVFLAFSTHTLGWRHGHAGLVVDAARGITLEAVLIGSDSATANASHWACYSNFIHLRLKDITPQEQQAIADYAMEHLNGIPYHLTSGVLSREKAPDPDSPGFGAQCAYLVWYALYQAGYDTDSDGGRIVTVGDLAESPLFEIVQVYGLDPRSFG